MSVIIVKKKNHKYRANLTFNNIDEECLIGRCGIGIKTKEGDGVTPKGKFKLESVFFRNDKITALKTCLTKKVIKPSMGWCTDSKNKKYNQLIKKPYNCIHEDLFINTSSYDIIISLSFNTQKRVPFRGSAIFLHCIGEQQISTEGCIAIRKDSLIKLVSLVTKSTRLIVA